MDSGIFGHGSEEPLLVTRTPLPTAGGKPGLSAESLRWVMGFYCALVGAFMLVAPHRYAGLFYESFRPYQQWWGMAALTSGMALLAVAILRPARMLSLAVHGVAGLTLLVLALSFAGTSAWTGAVTYASFGIGLIAAGLRSRPGSGGRDLFALLMGWVAAINGFILLVLPDSLSNFYLASSRPYLPTLGALLLGGGLLLLGVYLRPAPRWRLWAVHLIAGSAFLLLGLLVSLPRRSWTGIAFYLGCGTALALLPWLSRRLAGLDTRALRTRLALALASATSIALILTVAVATTQEERLSAQQVLETRKIEAQSIARTVSDYVELNAAQTATVAAMAGRTPLEPDLQRLFLAQTRPLYPRLTSLLSLDLRGRVLAVTGGVPLDAVDWRDVATDVARNRRVAVQLLPLPEQTPHLIFAAPILGADGAVAGVLVSVLEAGALRDRITRQGSNVQVADGHGRIIAHHDGTAPGEGAGVLPAGWDRLIAAGGTVPTADRLAAFAKVPSLGWVVAVERPRRSALAGVRQGRDMAFLLLLAVVPLAVLAGIVTARRIARPLGTLADAVDQMTAGNPGAPLTSSTISEVARLSAAFAEMRDRLAERTRESERLATELRARAEALADSDRRKDEFLAMLAHELRNPLGAIANAAYLLTQNGRDTPVAERSLAIIQRQIQHLVRLVDDLLDVSRITRGKVELRRERIDLSDGVRHAVDTLRPLVEAKSHSLEVDLPSEPLPLDADITRLEQVVGNLLRNAAKYTEPGGHLQVLVHREGGEAVLCVNDDGAGIAPDLLPRIFDLFTQGEQALDRSGAGLGIGLTLVRSLVEMHGGHVAAYSDGVGRGCRMEVRLPLAAPLDPAAEREPERALSTSPPDRR
jgi:signal transduction histidine kinase